MKTLRLTTASYLVLGLVRHLGSASPYDVKQAVAHTIGNFWALPHAQVYVQCDKLVEAGLLEQVQETTGRQRRTLTVSPAGAEALDEWLRDDTFAPIEARDQSLLKLFFGAPPEALAPTQINEHKRTLRAYENVAKTTGPTMDHGPASALNFALQYERWMVEFWTEQMNAKV